MRKQQNIVEAFIKKILILIITINEEKLKILITEFKSVICRAGGLYSGSIILIYIEMFNIILILSNANITQIN